MQVFAATLPVVDRAKPHQLKQLTVFLKKLGAMSCFLENGQQLQHRLFRE